MRLSEHNRATTMYRCSVLMHKSAYAGAKDGTPGAQEQEDKKPRARYRKSSDLQRQRASMLRAGAIRGKH